MIISSLLPVSSCRKSWPYPSVPGGNLSRAEIYRKAFGSLPDPEAYAFTRYGPSGAKILNELTKFSLHYIDLLADIGVTHHIEAFAAFVAGRRFGSPWEARESFREELGSQTVYISCLGGIWDETLWSHYGVLSRGVRNQMERGIDGPFFRVPLMENYRAHFDSKTDRRFDIWVPARLVPAKGQLSSHSFVAEISKLDLIDPANDPCFPPELDLPDRETRVVPLSIGCHEITEVVREKMA